MWLFNEQGLLVPAEGIWTTVDDLCECFVRSFPASETRAHLFQNWLNYNQLLRQEIGADFTQWINGSFVTQKLNPKDIDIVSFIPSHLFRKFEKRLDYYWTDNWEKEGVDAYLVMLRQANEADYSKTPGDIADWHKRYTSTKPVIGMHRQSKGFLMITVS